MSLMVETLASLVLTKTLEKGGPTLGKKALEQGGKLMGLLRRKSPETASAIEKVAEQPELAEQLPKEYGEAVLVAKVEEAARDEEIAEAVRALTEAVQTQPATIQNSGQIKIVNQANTINIKEQKVSI